MQAFRAILEMPSALPVGAAFGCTGAVLATKTTAIKTTS